MKEAPSARGTSTPTPLTTHHTPQTHTTHHTPHITHHTDVSHRGGKPKPAGGFGFASPRRYAAISLLRRRPQEKCSPTAARDWPDVSHRGRNLRQPEPSPKRIPDGMLRFRCSGDVPKTQPHRHQGLAWLSSVQPSLAQLSPARLSSAWLPSPAQLSTAQPSPA